MPVMLANIIEHLTAAESDITVVGRFNDGEQSLPAALAAEADVLVLQHGALSDGADSMLAKLLEQQPLTVLVLNDDGRDGAFYKFTSHNIRLDTFRNAFARAVRVAAKSESS
jgi:chemotaxis response regulator CheB